MTSSTDTETYIIRDGWPVADYREHGGMIERWFHKMHPYSMGHAIEHEGYSVETVERGSWKMRHYDAIMRPHTQTAGARVIVAMHDTISTAIEQHERISDSVPGEWRDYLAGDTIGRITAAAIEHLSYVDLGGMDAGTICGRLEYLASRIGYDLDADEWTGATTVHTTGA